MKHAIRILISSLLLLASNPPLGAQPALADLQRGVDWGVDHHYDQALALFTRLDQDHPHHPAPTFYRAAIYQSMMLDYETVTWRPLFYQDIEQTIHRARQLLSHQPQDPQAQFYAGAACAYKSAQLVRDGKYWPAWRAIDTALDYLNPLLRQDSSHCDALLGVGTYQYWRSYLTKSLSWLPFFPDRRREGIEKIVRVSECGQLSQSSAWSNLAWIYIREKNYAQAIAYAEKGLTAFPGSRFFLWPLAEAHFLDHNWAAAFSIYDTLLISTRAAEHNNGYNELVILWKMAQCAEQMGDLQGAETLYWETAECRVDAEMAKRAENKKQAAAKWLARHAGEMAESGS